MRFVAIVGPTASGKSALALAVAERLDAEIISCDSMQVYRGLDIGTAKPTLAERARVPHHLVDVVGPADPFDAARYAQLADVALDAVAARGRLALVVGGAGLYLRALRYGLVSAATASPEIRARHAAVVDTAGVEALYAELCRLDPESARTINARDRVRISRALELYEATGTLASVLRRQHALGAANPRHTARVLVLPPPADLRAAIHARVDAMVARGWVDEVRTLLAAAYSPELRPLQAIGYRELVAFVTASARGEAVTLDDTVLHIKSATWRYAKRQSMWWRKEPGVEFVSAASAGLGLREQLDAVLPLIESFGSS